MHADEALEQCAALIKEAYQGIRPAPGYPACPEHTVKADVFKLLQWRDRARTELERQPALACPLGIGFYCRIRNWYSMPSIAVIRC